jgi:adenosyl cobinamide kinase/adenosyl cobinamide phosphate guanylyltransferase
MDFTKPRFTLDDLHPHRRSAAWKKQQALACSFGFDSIESEDEGEDAVAITRVSNLGFVTKVTSCFRSALRSQERARLAIDAQNEAITVLQKLVGVANEIFGDDVMIGNSVDPEFPDEVHTVLTPCVNADSATVLRMESEWVAKVAEIAPGWHRFRLYVKLKR